MMENLILAVLKYPDLKEHLSTGGLEEIKSFSWDTPASKCVLIYDDALSKM